MADKKFTDQNATPKDANDPLRGGTQGGGTAPQVGSASGGTNSISPSGGSQPDRRPEGSPAGAPPDPRGTRNDARDDAEDIFEGSRKRSQSDAKQRARDAADAPTQARSPHGAGEPRHHQIHGDPTKAPGSQGDNEADAPASRGESTGGKH